MFDELNVKIIRNGDHLEIFQDGLMVAKREAIDKILSDGEVAEFYDNWVYPTDEKANEKIGEIITGLFSGDYAKVE